MLLFHPRALSATLLAALLSVYGSASPVGAQAACPDREASRCLDAAFDIDGVQLDGGSVLWTATQGPTTALKLHAGGETEVLATAPTLGFSVSDVVLDAGRVAWVEGGSTLRYFDGEQTRTLSTGMPVGGVRLDRGVVVWLRGTGDLAQLWTVSTGDPLRLDSASPPNIRDVRLDAPVVAFVQGTGGVVRYFDGSTTRTVSTFATNPDEIQLDLAVLIWRQNGSLLKSFDGQTTRNLNPTNPSSAASSPRLEAPAVLFLQASGLGELVQYDDGATTSRLDEGGTHTSLFLVDGTGVWIRSTALGARVERTVAGAPREVLDEGGVGASFTDLQTDDANVVWVNVGAGELCLAPGADCDGEAPLDSASSFSEVQLVRSSVAWVRDGTTLRLHRDGATSDLDDRAPFALVVLERGGLVWLNADGELRFATEPDTEPLNEGDVDAAQVVSDDFSVAWVENVGTGVNPIRLYVPEPLPLHGAAWAAATVAALALQRRTPRRRNGDG